MDRIYYQLIVNGVPTTQHDTIREAMDRADTHLDLGATCVKIARVTVEDVMEKRRAR